MSRRDEHEARPWSWFRPTKRECGAHRVGDHRRRVGALKMAYPRSTPPASAGTESNTQEPHGLNDRATASRFFRQPDQKSRIHEGSCGRRTVKPSGFTRSRRNDPGFAKQHAADRRLCERHGRSAHRAHASTKGSPRSCRWPRRGFLTTWVTRWEPEAAVRGAHRRVDAST